MSFGAGEMGPEPTAEDLGMHVPTGSLSPTGSFIVLFSKNLSGKVGVLCFTCSGCRGT